MNYSPATILWSVLGILVSGSLGALAGYSLVWAVGLAGIPAAVVAVVVGMVTATGVWLAITLVLRRAGMVR
ncbi:MAG TPA: hypothetical protein VMN56_17225 [Casimicrobiaceae bacterium]|nr:hypothetical protein [Casimicrobiaceae bacterium]